MTRTRATRTGGSCETTLGVARVETPRTGFHQHMFLAVGERSIIGCKTTLSTSMACGASSTMTGALSIVSALQDGYKYALRDADRDGEISSELLPLSIVTWPASIWSSK